MSAHIRINNPTKDDICRVCMKTCCWTPIHQISCFLHFRATCSNKTFLACCVRCVGSRARAFLNNPTKNVLCRVLKATNVLVSQINQICVCCFSQQLVPTIFLHSVAYVAGGCPHASWSIILPRMTSTEFVCKLVVGPLSIKFLVSYISVRPLLQQNFSCVLSTLRRVPRTRIPQ